MSSSNPLVQAAIANDTATLKKLLLEEAHDPSSCDDLGRTALHIAANAGDVNMAEMLVLAGADYNKADWKGSTPLHLASIRNHGNLVKMLVSYGADRTRRDARGKSPLEWVRDRLERTRYLIVTGCDCDSAHSTQHSLVIAKKAIDDLCSTLTQQTLTSPFPSPREGASPGDLTYSLQALSSRMDTLSLALEANLKRTTPQQAIETELLPVMADRNMKSSVCEDFWQKEMGELASMMEQLLLATERSSSSEISASPPKLKMNVTGTFKRERDDLEDVVDDSVKFADVGCADDAGGDAEKVELIKGVASRRSIEPENAFPEAKRAHNEHGAFKEDR